MPPHDDRWYEQRLAPPAGRPRVVIDSDAANEIDDQFAIVWALLAPERLDVRALHAAPFSFAHRRDALAVPFDDPRLFGPPEDGMERSLDEMRRLTALVGGDATRLPVLRGARGYLRSETRPQPSEALDHLVALAMQQPAEEPLYVLTLGCATNVASALIAEPALADRIVVVWTSGYPSHAPQVNDSFNLEQDVAASRVLFDSGVPLVYLPGFHVGAQLRLSWPEVERYVDGRGPIGAYLHHLYTHNPLWRLHGVGDLFAHSWVIWDLICVAWMLEPGWVPSGIVRAPRLADDRRWLRDDTRHPMREAYAVRRDAIFRDVFLRLDAAARPT